MYTVNVKSAPIYLLALLVLIGCSGGSSGRTAVKGDPPKETNYFDDPTSGNPGTAGSDSGPKQPGPKDGTNDTKIPPPLAIKDPRPVTLPETGGWKDTTLEASKLAANVANKMKSALNTECKAVITSKTPEGVGQSVMHYRLSSPTAYRVEYLEPGLIPKRSTIVADGKVVKLYANNKWALQRPVRQGLQPDEVVVDPERFMREFSRSMISGLVDKVDAWSPLFTRLTSGAEGFETKLEERHVPFNGRKYTSYRLFARRTAEAEKRLGPAKMEIVIDSKYWLPVTIRTDESPIGEKPWSYEWSGQWRFNHKFTPGELELVPKKPDSEVKRGV